MARSGNSRVVQRTPEVALSIELRPATSEQLEAGKRLFSRLMARAQVGQDQRAGSATGGVAEAAARASPSLTNRGTLSSKEGWE